MAATQSLCLLMSLAITTLMQQDLVAAIYTHAEGEVLNRLLSPYNYGKMMKPPTEDYKPTLVNVTMYISHLGTPSDTEMTFRMQFYFRQYWNVS